MPSYAAFLGHQPHISIAELAAVVPGFTLRQYLENRIAIFDSTEPIDPRSFTTLGGVVALAERASDHDLTVSDVPQVLLNCITKVKGKVTFGLRTYGMPTSAVREMYRRYKTTLKKEGRPSRYVGNEKHPAPAVLLHDAGMLDGKHGCEITLIQTENDLWVGRTIAAQDVDSYSKRDMQKPVRDTTVGLLPPKLAQIMLNFGLWLVHSRLPAPAPGAKKKPSKTSQLTVFDPFCGTGVIPMEALLRGWHVLASDLSVKAVNGCLKNLEWLRKEEKILKKDVTSDVWKQDAAKPFTLKNLPDVVVTETSLGPSLTKVPNQRDLAKIKREAEELEIDFLTNAAKTLPGVPLVCTWPFWRVKGQIIRLEKPWEKLHDIGYRAAMPAGVDLQGNDRLSLLYARKDQLVGREIVMLLPK